MVNESLVVVKYRCLRICFVPLNATTHRLLLMDGKFHWTLSNKCCSMTMCHFVYCSAIPGSILSSVYCVFHVLPGSTWVPIGFSGFLLLQLSELATLNCSKGWMCVYMVPWDALAFYPDCIPASCPGFLLWIRHNPD